MLCDDLIVDKELRLCYDGLDRVFNKIRAAQKFILSREFAIAADGLVDNLPELYKIVPYCRVPYPLTWVEWVHDDRPHWNPEGPYKARPVDPKRFQHAPLRVGFLMEQMDNKASHWKTHLFWSMKDKPHDASQFNGSLGALVLDTAKVKLDAEDPLMDAMDGHVMADFGQGFVTMVEQRAPDVARMLGEHIVEDWGGEVRFLISMLGLLNARNVTQHVSVDNTRYNAKRAKNNKRPLFSHTLLKIRPDLYVRDRQDSIENQHRDLRLHFVRGHFKHRKSGLFWWSMHARGSGKHGVVVKDYEIEA